MGFFIAAENQIFILIYDKSVSRTYTYKKGNTNLLPDTLQNSPSPLAKENI